MMITRNDHPTVLVVDDLDEGRSLVSQWFRMHGCHTVEAVNGQQAVEVALREHPDLILMDINMPQLDGFTAMRRMRAYDELRDIRIVAVTAQCAEELYGAAFDAGCNEFVAKPIDPQKLENLIRCLPSKEVH